MDKTIQTKEDLIKELDPDYYRCKICEKLFHLDELIVIYESGVEGHYYCCKDDEPCVEDES